MYKKLPTDLFSRNHLQWKYVFCRYAPVGETLLAAGCNRYLFLQGERDETWHSLYKQPCSNMQMSGTLVDIAYSTQPFKFTVIVTTHALQQHHHHRQQQHSEENLMDFTSPAP
ncbi:UNVERIFIED_CONTAM: hypothetical protein PYX00_003090 [Menopon gallinae]|uniref:Uncharacterized protein n=1 Tax=Menopon gallinae TaxID=328185 RepID=A0AAW2I0C7_9NEOP